MLVLVSIHLGWLSSLLEAQVLVSFLSPLFNALCRAAMPTTATGRRAGCSRGDGFLARMVELTRGSDGGASPVGDGGVAPSIQSSEAGGESPVGGRGAATHGRPTARAQRRVPPWLEDPTSPVQADAGGDPLPSDATPPAPLSSLFLPPLFSSSPSHALSRSLSLSCRLNGAPPPGKVDSALGSQGGRDAGWEEGCDA